MIGPPDRLGEHIIFIVCFHASNFRIGSSRTALAGAVVCNVPRYLLAVTRTYVNE